MRKLSMFSILLTLIAIGISCESDSTPTGIIEDATVVWGGDPSKDGCGWLLETQDSIYKPMEIPSGFEVDNLKVVINYQKLNSKYICGWSLGITYIQISTIKLRFEE